MHALAGVSHERMNGAVSRIAHGLARASSVRKCYVEARIAAPDAHVHFATRLRFLEEWQ
jgi:hypothetical protein